MPIYEYECSACKHRFERSQRFSDPPVTECPACGGAVRRVLFPAGIVFKGSGWYITDSRRTTSGEATSSPAGSTNGKSDTAAKGESPASTAKTETSASSTSSAGTD